MTQVQPAASARTAPRFAEFVGMMAALMALTALSIDVMLPALPQIRDDFGLADPNRQQLVVTLYMVGFAVGQRVLFHTSRLPAEFPETWMAGHVSRAIVPVKSDPAPRVISDELDPVAASLAAMAAVSLRGIEMLDVRFGDLVVVMGQGLIGQASAQLARARGATVKTAEPAIAQALRDRQALPQVLRKLGVI